MTFAISFVAVVVLPILFIALEQIIQVNPSTEDFAIGCFILVAIACIALIHGAPLLVRAG